VALPDPVDRDPRRERVARLEQPPGEVATIRAVLRPFNFIGGEDRRHARRDDPAGGG